MDMQKSQNAHIGLKMSISIAIPLIALISVAILGVVQIRVISSDLITSLLKQVNKSNALILNADRDFYQAMQAYLKMQNTTNPEVLKGEKADFLENSQQTVDRVTQAVDALKDSNVLKLVHKTEQKTIPELFKGFSDNFTVWQSLFNVDTNTMKDEKLFWKTFNSSRDNINYITEIIEEYAQLSVKRNENMVNNISYLMMGISVAVLALSAIIGFILANSISKIITESMDQLLDSADRISGISTDVANGSRRFAEASSEQAASVEEVSATLEETSAMVQTNSDNSQNAYKLSQAVNDALSSGSTKMSEMMNSMDLIKDSSREITNVLKAIESIAFQTNILSLNAAVEAARAGDAGKGFAVVADEVRALAHRSAQEAQSISHILEKNIGLSDSATEVAGEACSSFEQIQKKVSEISVLIDGLAKSGEEQRIGITQISETMQHMGQVVQNIATDASNNMEMAESLLNPVEDMQTMARRLSLRKDTDKPVITDSTKLLSTE